jgi:hypothetical protein
MTNRHNHSSAGSAVAALAKRFWSIHPKEIQGMGITREQFYEREMLSLLATLVPTEPQTPSNPTAERDVPLQAKVQQAIMAHPHFEGSATLAFGLAGAALKATPPETRPER